MQDNIYQFRLRPVKPPRPHIFLGYDPDSAWVCYSRQGHFAFLPRDIADEFDMFLSYRRVGVCRIFGVEEIDAMRATAALFGLAYETVDAFAFGLHEIQREGDVLDDHAAASRGAAA